MRPKDDVFDSASIAGKSRGAGFALVSDQARKHDAIEFFKQRIFGCSKSCLIRKLKEISDRFRTFAVITAHRKMQFLRRALDSIRFLHNLRAWKMEHRTHANATPNICRAGSQISPSRMK